MKKTLNFNTPLWQKHNGLCCQTDKDVRFTVPAVCENNGPFHKLVAMAKLDGIYTWIHTEFQK